MGLTIEAPGPAIDSGQSGASVCGHGTATSPGAAASIASVAAASLTAGQVYKLDVYAYIDGTVAAATDDDNMRLVINGVTIGATLCINANTADQNPVSMTIVTPAVDGVHNITLQTIVAGTAGAVYHGTLIATPLGP